MSFFINNSNGAKPGPVGNNGVNGICERVVIETTKVFDACICQSTETGVILQVTNLNPANPTLPLTFVSAQTTTNNTTISDLVIDRLDSCPNFANVTATITIPVTVTFRDANGILGTGTANVVVNKSVILFVPQPAVAPINISATAVFSSEIGNFVSDATFSVNACIQIIIKVTAPVDLLIPSYGYPFIPQCQRAPETSCPGLNVPLYPTANGSGAVPNLNN